jgi:hypothetical protein
VSLYSPPVKLSSEEEWLLSHCKWAKLFVFPVAHRRELFTTDVQREPVYSETKAGKAFRRHCWRW